MATRRKKAAKKKRVSSARRRAEQRESLGAFTTLNIPDGIELFKPEKEGAIMIDILPYKTKEGNPFCDAGEEHYERTFFVHRGIGAKNNSYVCPARTFEKRCPICEWREKETKDPDGDEKKLKGLAPKERQLFNVVDHRQPDKGVMLWEVSFHNFGKLLDSRIKNSDDEEDGYAWFYELSDDGLTLKVTLDESQFDGQKYLEASAIDFKPRKGTLATDNADKAVCLDEVVKEIGYKELRSIFLQIDDTTEDDDGDDSDVKEPSELEEPSEIEEDSELEEPSEVEPEDDDIDEESVLEDDDEEWEDDEPEEPSEIEEDSEVEPEEDDDDDWDDEEEETPPPKKKPAKKKAAPKKRAAKKKTRSRK